MSNPQKPVSPARPAPADAEEPLADEAAPAADGALPAGVDAPDSLMDLILPAATAAGRTEAGPRISTVLGPLEEHTTARETRDLNDAVHGILIVGLVVSTVLLLSGVFLALAQGGGLPSATLDIGLALQNALALQPAGLLSLGLVALMFTPILRVIGSVVVFFWERDWLYAGVTAVVLVVLIVSLLVGHG